MRTTFIGKALGALFVIFLGWAIMSYALVFSCLSSSRDVRDCRENTAGYFVEWTLSPFVK